MEKDLGTYNKAVSLSVILVSVHVLTASTLLGTPPSHHRLVCDWPLLGWSLITWIWSIWTSTWISWKNGLLKSIFIFNPCWLCHILLSAPQCLMMSFTWLFSVLFVFCLKFEIVYAAPQPTWQDRGTWGITFFVRDEGVLHRKNTSTACWTGQIVQLSFGLEF